MAKQADNTANTVNLIALSTKIVGEINSETDIRVDGNIQGKLVTAGRLIVGHKGIINGEITCRSAEIEGTIDGKIDVKELLTLKESSVLTGEVATGKLMIEPGAIFSGNCKMNNKTEAKSK